MRGAKFTYPHKGLVTPIFHLPDHFSCMNGVTRVEDAELRPVLELRGEVATNNIWWLVETGDERPNNAILQTFVWGLKQRPWH